jgi:hypothetical protein
MFESRFFEKGFFMPNAFAQLILEKRDRALQEIEDSKKAALKISVQKEVEEALTRILATIDGYDGAVMLLSLSNKMPDERAGMILEGISKSLGIDLRSLSTLMVTDMNVDVGGRSDWYWTVRTVQLIEALRKS